MSLLRKNKSKYCAISGADLCKFYHRPLDTYKKSDEHIDDAEDVFSYIVCDSLKNETKKFLTKSTQTDYRESSAQTDPWDPPFKVSNEQKNPEVLSLQNFHYGNGLPAGILEVSYLAKKREIKNLEVDLESEGCGDSNANTDMLQDKIKNEWNYRIASLNHKQAEKLSFMQNAITEELKVHSDKKRNILRNMWRVKKDELKERKLKLEKKLQKESKSLDSSLESKDNTSFSKLEDGLEKNMPPKQKKTKGKKNEIDYLLSRYYLSDPTGLSNVQKWLETKTSALTSVIPLPRTTKRNQRENLAEKAYQYLLEKKRSKMPSKVYNEEFVKEETPAPSVKAEDVLELLDFDEEKDSVIVWQQVLRGLAYQKQMLELIDRHEDGLSTLLSAVYPGINKS